MLNEVYKRLVVTGQVIKIDMNNKIYIADGTL